MTCRHVAQPIPHGVAPQQSPATLRLRGKDSDLEQTPDTKPQILSLQNDPLDYNSVFPACILTYTPKRHQNCIWQKCSAMLAFKWFNYNANNCTISVFGY
jgi:hypothetical protein